MQQQLVEIEGTVESIVFRNQDTAFTVLDLCRNDTLITVVGEMLGVEVGEKLKLHGFFTSHPTYGSQFKVSAYERTLPSTANAIGKYLASGAVKGIGPIIAQRLVEAFGDNTLEVLEKTPERLAEVKGVTQKKAASIAEEYQKLFGIRTIMLYLSKFGIQSVTAIAIWKRWGTEARAVIEDNPYILCAQDFGLTFEDCEEIAIRQNLEIDSIKRMRAAINYILRGNTSNGHTCLPQDKLGSTAVSLTDDGINVFDEALDMELESGSLIAVDTGGRRHIYLLHMFEAESRIAQRVQLMMMMQPVARNDYTAQIKKLEQQTGIQYAARQREAIGEALNTNLFILTGGPGTGKTTTINAIIHLLEAQGKTVGLTAPTGRAAKRMTQVTGREAKTIHRMLEVDFTERNALKFRRNMKNPLPYNVVIVDEVSMVDVLLMDCLMDALRMGAGLILVGDSDQLPSVGAGNVLRDFIAAETIPCVQLKEIFRQAAESLIVTNAHTIVEGKMPCLTSRSKDFFFMERSGGAEMVNTVVDLCSRRLPTTYGYSPVWDIQVLAPTRIGAAGTTELNKALQEKLNPPDKSKAQLSSEGRVLREGDKVMQIKNNYDLPWTDQSGECGMGVYNGDIGIIKMLDKGSKTILVDYEDRVAEYSFDNADQLEHAYAITVHKSQGSEFEAVVLPIMSFGGKMHYRNLLYTAVTRAKSNLVLLGTPATIQKMVENNRKTIRYTNLLEMLLGQAESL